MKLAGKVALVTGASAGIGKASALALAQQGADVAINYLTLPEGAEEVAGQIRALGRKAILCRVDVSDQAAVEAMVGRVVAELGRLDVSMWGAFYGLRATVNQMIKQGGGGCAVIVSSPHAILAFPSCMAYNMAKA